MKSKNSKICLRISRAHQNHYQHLGDLHGTAVVNGATHNLELQLLRDHTHGARDWRLMHRYAIQHFTTETGLRYGYLENGKRGREE